MKLEAKLKLGTMFIQLNSRLHAVQGANQATIRGLL